MLIIYQEISFNQQTVMIDVAMYLMVTFWVETVMLFPLEQTI